MENIWINNILGVNQQCSVRMCSVNAPNLQKNYLRIVHEFPYPQNVLLQLHFYMQWGVLESTRRNDISFCDCLRLEV